MTSSESCLEEKHHGCIQGLWLARCRVALLGLGIPAAAVAQCKQYVIQIPCEAEAGLHKLRTKLEGSSVRGLSQPLNQALDDLQACHTVPSWL